MQRIKAAISALLARWIWRHQWVQRDEPFKLRKCSVCGQMQVLCGDDWGSSWETLITGVKSRHYSKGE